MPAEVVRVGKALRCSNSKQSAAASVVYMHKNLACSPISSLGVFQIFFKTEMLYPRRAQPFLYCDC